MMDDLAARLAVATGRLGEAVREIERQFNELHFRSARFAKDALLIVKQRSGLG